MSTTVDLTQRNRANRLEWLRANEDPDVTRHKLLLAEDAVEDLRAQQTSRADDDEVQPWLYPLIGGLAALIIGMIIMSFVDWAEGLETVLVLGATAAGVATGFSYRERESNT